MYTIKDIYLDVFSNANTCFLNIKTEMKNVVAYYKNLNKSPFEPNIFKLLT